MNDSATPASTETIDWRRLIPTAKTAAPRPRLRMLEFAANHNQKSREARPILWSTGVGSSPLVSTLKTR